ncbi:PBECR4 domain-containing protein [Bariatricus sp. SGI.161]|uniref:PBECR4 domain-containing protein n=1 Tax=Bariatricus sp. SGI.161 TaxID=3420550 RepID=UPI002A7C72B2|nr:PBECR4 domain-containing protein [Lachnospiraceae bacterium]
MKYDKKKALEIIVETAKQYDKWLKSNHFLIFYQKGKEQDCVEVGFRDLNFLHLTGIKTKLSAQRFFSLCIDGKLSSKCWFQIW